MPLSILIPLRLNKKTPLIDYSSQHYLALLNKGTFELIIVDSSPNSIFSYVEKKVQSHASVKHINYFKYINDHNPILNNKTRAVELGLRFCSNDKIWVLDDDLFPTLEQINTIQELLDFYDLVTCCSTHPLTPSMDLLIHANEQFYATATKGEYQPNGNSAYRKSTLNEIGFYKKDCLFEDGAIIKHFKKNNKKIHFANEIHLVTVSKGKGQFFEQRIRYGFELLSFPVLSAIFLLIVPLSTYFFITKQFMLLISLHITLQGYSLVTNYRGYFKKHRNYYPIYTPLFSIALLYSYMITVWFALYVRLFTPGIPYGSSRIKKPI